MFQFFERRRQCTKLPSAATHQGCKHLLFPGKPSLTDYAIERFFEIAAWQNLSSQVSQRHRALKLIKIWRKHWASLAEVLGSLASMNWHSQLLDLEEEYCSFNHNSAPQDSCIQPPFGRRAFPNSREITEISLLVSIWSSLCLDKRKWAFYWLSLGGHTLFQVLCFS